MNHLEFTRQSPDKLQFHFQGWEPETSPGPSFAWFTAWASIAVATLTSPRR